MSALNLLTPHLTQAAGEIAKQLVVSVAEVAKHKIENPSPPDPVTRKGNQTIYSLVSIGNRNEQPKEAASTSSSNLGASLVTGAALGLGFLATVAGGAYVANRLVQNGNLQQNAETPRRRRHVVSSAGRVVEVEDSDEDEDEAFDFEAAEQAMIRR